MIDVATLYEGWLSGLSHKSLAGTVTFSNGKHPSISTIRNRLIKAYGKRACDRKSNSLRRSLFQDLLRGKIKVSARDYEAMRRWIISAPESDLDGTKFYADGEMYRDASRNFEFKPEIHLTETEEYPTVYQVVTVYGEVMDCSEVLGDLLQNFQVVNDQIWTKSHGSGEQQVYAACQLTDY